MLSLLYLLVLTGLSVTYHYKLVFCKVGVVQYLAFCVGLCGSYVSLCSFLSRIVLSSHQFTAAGTVAGFGVLKLICVLFVLYVSLYIFNINILKVNEAYSSVSLLTLHMYFYFNLIIWRSQQVKPPRYSWHIIESGVKHHKSNHNWLKVYCLTFSIILILILTYNHTYSFFFSLLISSYFKVFNPSTFHKRRTLSKTVCLKTR